MRLVGRILWVLLAFMIASTAAALVVTIGSLQPKSTDAPKVLGKVRFSCCLERP